MKKFPDISVIIPVYNAEKTIIRCVKSICKQSYQNIEIILIDDGSSDKSYEICKKLSYQDSRIHVYRQKNKGVSSARNNGINQAKGKYICFVDSDDWVDPDYVGILIKYMVPNGMSASGIYNNSNRRLNNPIRVTYLSIDEAQISVLSLKGIQGFPFGKLFDREVIEKFHIRFNEEITICEDLLFVITYLSHCKEKCCQIHQKTYHYLVTGNGATKSRFWQSHAFNRKDLSEILAIQQCYKYVKKESKAYYAIRIRFVKAAVNTARTLISYNMSDDPLYGNLLKIIRKDAFRYIRSPYSVLSSDFSVFLSAISPKLELWFWKFHERNFH